MSFGPVIRRFGRVPIFLLGALLNLGVILGLFFWKPDEDAPVLFFVVAGVWGVADAIWQTQINGNYNTNYVKTTTTLPYSHSHSSYYENGLVRWYT